jgi:hypothetical protein
MSSPQAASGEAGQPSTAAVLGNLFLYQAAWFACILGAAAGYPLLGTAASIGAVAWRMAWAQQRWAELQLILLAGLVGGAWENLLTGLDWVRYQGAEPAGLAPLWIIALWLAFATTFNVSLRWLRPRPVLSALLGLIGGPLAWWGGARLGALELVDRDFALVMIGLGWAALMPLLLAAAAWLEASALSQARQEG